MDRIGLDLRESSYDIIIADKALSYLPDEILRLGLERYSAVAVSNSKIYSLYKEYLKPYLGVFKDAVFLEVEDSEKSKSWEVISHLLESILEFSKSDSPVFIAFGGGVIGDLTGFLASIYKRGVPFIQLPTTLLAQVDASIGGKVAIDLKQGKNLIGSFYQPKLVLSDLDLLKSLDSKEILNGLSEIIKYGILGDRELFELLESQVQDPALFSLSLWAEIVSRCVKIKRDIVQKDERDDKDIRIALNLGHTIAHALESAFEYQMVSHGEAVSLGLIVESIISNKVGMLKREDLDRIINLILKFKTLPRIDKELDKSKVLKSILYDKKAKFGALRFILPKTIGSVVIFSDPEERLILSALDEGLRYI
jgi:3-dehydroquinate synthase